MAAGGPEEGGTAGSRHAPAPHQALWNCNLSTVARTPTPRAPHSLEGLTILSEVAVSDPQQITDGMRKYTTFQVAGKYVESGSVTATEFSARRRYSDFEWLRNTLRSLFPGIVFQPLPRKQQMGRFEAAFLEERRAGLDEFLHHIFARPGLFRPGSALIAFLTFADGALDKVKPEFSANSRSLGDLFREYSAAFGSELQAVNFQAPENGSGTAIEEPAFAETKTAMDLYVRHLDDAQRWTGGLCEAHRKVASTTAEVHTRLSSLRDDDRRLCEEGGEARSDLISALSQQGAVYAAVPSGHFEQLLAALAKEQRQAEAVLEALDSIAALQRRLQNARRRVSEDEFGHVRLARRSEAEGQPSFQPDDGSMNGLRERKRDKIYDAWDKLRGRDASRQLEDLREQLCKDRQEVDQGQRWLAAARTVFAGTEIRSFFAAKREAQEQAQQQFLQAAARTSQRLAEVWTTGAAAEVLPAAAGAGAAGAPAF